MYSPESSYNPSRMGWGQRQSQGQISPYSNYRQTPGVMPTQMAYPPMYPRPPQQPQIIFPLVMQPMQQISGLPMLQQQNQPQPQFPLQPQLQNQVSQQQQGVSQMPQSQMQQQQQQQQQTQPQMPFSPGFGAQMPQQPQMQLQPAQQMPQPQVQQQPQPQVPFSPSFGGQMPQQMQMQPQVQQQPQSQMEFSPDPGAHMPQPQVPFMRSPQIQRNQTPFPRSVQMPEPEVPLTPNPQSGMQQGPMPPPLVPEPQLSQPQMAFSLHRQMPEPSVSNQGQQQAQNQFLQASYGEGPVIPMMRSPQQNRDFGDTPGQAPMPQQQLPPSLSRTPSLSTVTDNTNPLPEPPREFEIPAHLLSGTAMAHVGPQFPRSRTPLKHPLPDLPRDVYLSKKYRKLLVGSAYEGREKEVYPSNWFTDERGHTDGPASLGRALARLNPFRSRHESSTSPRQHRRHDTMPEFFEFVRDGGAGVPAGGGSITENTESATRGGNRFGLGRSFTLGGPFARHRREPELDQLEEGPPVGWMPTVPIVGEGVGPQPQQPFSPSPVPPLVAGQGPSSSSSSSSRDGVEPIRFNFSSPEYNGFCHLSPHRVLYKNTLYPSAVHLLEAHKFLGRRDDIAELVRGARDLHELGRIVSDSQRHARRDWERVVLRKMENVLYLKFVQHPELRNLLLNTGLADLIYAEANDSFWGEGALRDGANELGRALMRVRARLRDEASGRSSQ
ncbi:hypothetical protein EW145_g4965 [Phellinidium pouzarii]|uniref:NADAR domain-containing protein n=1 Tax=Phellinidium pouzarii TaxID=167371 RepID=A0A4S4L1M1_9AGAM|nr:hypothetical protein EW145_g4965 [Phellinidium pouzarii]